MKQRKKEHQKTVFGRVHSIRRGGAYLILDSGEADAFIPENAMNGGMNGDLVTAAVTGCRYDGVVEARVISVEERAHTKLVGMVEHGKLIPDDHRLPEMTLLYDKGQAQTPDGMKAVATITSYPAGRAPLMGRVSEVLGKAGDPGVDIMSAIRRHGIREVFPEEAVLAANDLPQQVEQNQLAGRLDLRDTMTFTIDGAHSKDFDDAVSVTKLPNGNLELGVHIADVSAYVKENDPLDREARLRGTSVYFADRVIPMLPEALSNGICSLNEGVDRLTLSCIMEVDGVGEVRNSKLVESVIRSHHRLVYDDVSALLTWDGTRCEMEGYDKARIDELTTRYSDVLESLQLLSKLQVTLSAKRRMMGSVDFDLPESEIILDDRGRCVGLKRAKRGIANRIIEECMLLCNQVVAQTLHANNAPCLYRVHEPPDSDRLRELNVFLGTLGYGVRHVQGPKPRDIQVVLARAEGTNEEGLIGKLMLRSMKKARYDGECLGHFGLAFSEYCHFTSPIRRYPDLFVHRAVKLLIKGELEGTAAQRLSRQLKSLGESTSAAERSAMEAERDVDVLKKCEYMDTCIGETYTGLVSGVMPYGIYVELPNTAEGLVRLAAFDDDFYIAEPKLYRIIGRSHGRIIRLGDPIEVTVQGVDFGVPAIDFIPQTRYHNQSIYNTEKSAVKAGKAEAGKNKRRAGDKDKNRASTRSSSRTSKLKRGGKSHATRNGRKAPGSKPKSKT